MYHYWCGCLDHIHKMYMVAVTLPSYPAFRPMFVINILIYKIPKQFSEICGNLRHYLQIVFILVLIKHICLAAICKWCFCVKKVFFFFFYQSWSSSFINNVTKFWPSKFRYFKFHHLFSSFREYYSWALAMLVFLIFDIFYLWFIDNTGDGLLCFFSVWKPRKTPTCEPYIYNMADQWEFMNRDTVQSITVTQKELGNSFWDHMS